ncbi:MAG: hypothetical protein C0597_07965 [Marinilabiliales bacterium]|nr:MAG: hypothetical protein C0597_07965 [Marinilabiliales bacterium]
MKNLLAFIIIAISVQMVIAKETEFNIEEFTASIEPSDISPEIDGIINSEEWEKAYTFDNFWDHWPSDNNLSEYQTEVKVTYDQEFLYLAVKLADNNSEKIIQTLKRDSENEFWNSDGFAVVIDPINSKSNGYIFGINAGGSQFE